MSEELKKLIGKNVLHYRTLRNMSQKALAAKIGKTNQYLSALEHGNHNPSASTLQDIAEALDIDAGLLFRKTKKSGVE